MNSQNKLCLCCKYQLVFCYKTKCLRTMHPLKIIQTGYIRFNNDFLRLCKCD